MSSSGRIESTVEEVEVGSGVGSEIEPKLLHAAGDGTGGGGLNNGLPIVVVVSMNDSSSKPTIVLNSSPSGSYEIGVHEIKRTYSPDSGDSNSQERIISYEKNNPTPSEIHIPHTTDDKKLSPPDHFNAIEIFNEPLSPDDIEGKSSQVLPHHIVDSDDSPDSNPGRKFRLF